MANLYFFLATTVLATFCSMLPKVEAQDCTINSYTDVASVCSSCTTITVGSFDVPANTTLTFHLKEGASLIFTGTISFEVAAWGGYLTVIMGNNVTVDGTQDHLFHGNGQDIWDGKGLNGGVKPTLLYLRGIGSTFKNLNLKNCPARCVAIDASENSTIQGFTIDNSEGAPGQAPLGQEGHNTDGFDVFKSSHITIEDSNVTNQDDCVAINQGAHILVNNLTCVGSHGFDIATGMSAEYSKNVVENVTFSNSLLIGGMYGLHILTCSDGGKGKVDRVNYTNIQIQGPCDWGIVIQQDFSNAKQGSTKIPTGNVPVTNVIYNNIEGFMDGEFSSAIVFRCATGGCSGIRGNNVNITGANRENECSFQPSGFSC